MQCEYFGTCGGCSLQHQSYEYQLEHKRGNVERLLGMPTKAVSSPPFAYRNRMDFLFHPGGVGLRKRGDWKTVVDVERCPIATDRVNRLLQEVRSFTEPDAFDPRKKTGTLRYAVIRANKDAAISFTLNEDSPRLAHTIDRIKEFAKSSTADHVMIARVPKDRDVSTSMDAFVVKGGTLLTESLLGKNFCFPIQGFFQNNTVVANKLQAHVHSLLEHYNTGDAHLLDLYGGVGTFGINNADLFRSTTIVEGFAPAIDRAKHNGERHNVRVRPIAKDAQYLKNVDLPAPLYVITDPPRSGMHQKTIQQLNVLKPEAVIYVSCNPKQLAKDLLKFPHYEVRSCTLFDMFPQTPHAEVVVELSRK